MNPSTACLLGASGAFKPTQLSGIVLWLRGDLGVTPGATFTWADQSGTGDANKNCSSTGAARPTSNPINASYNNQATVDFSAAPTYLTSGTWAAALTQPFTEFVVGNTPVPAASVGAIDNLSSSEAACLSAAVTGNPSTYAGSFLSNAGDWSSKGAMGAVYNNAASSLYFNSRTATASGPIGSNNGRTGTTIGSLFNLLAANSWNGPIAEIITYNRILTSGEIAQVMQYLGARYSISIA